MEVQIHSLSNFDLSSKSPFSLSSELQNLRFRSSDQMESEANEVDLSSDDDKPPATTGGTEWLGRVLSAAMKVQKVYRSYRTRRMLADSAVVAEALWWQAIEYAQLNKSTVSFFNLFKAETPASRWNRICLNASKVGKGLSKDAKAQKLAFQHWIEAIDPRHRYGHSLHLYYEEWCKADAGQPFFYWLDIGDGKEIDLEICPKSKLREQCIKYLGPHEREQYEYIVLQGKIAHKQTWSLLDTNKGSKWIFVLSTSQKLYAGEKKKGRFHHSSFLAGGATLAAGRLVAEDGILKSISPYSGHYRPTDDRLQSLLSILRENGVNLKEVELHKANEDYEKYEESKSNLDETIAEASIYLDPPRSEVSRVEEEQDPRTLCGGLQCPRAEVLPNTAPILQRISSKKAVKSYQLSARPRIGCVADYPVQLRLQALEFVTNKCKHVFRKMETRL